MRSRLLFITLPLLLAACATTPAERQREATDQARTQDKLTTALAGYTPGKPQTCVEPRTFTDTKRFGQTILFNVGNRTIYRTDTGVGCEDALNRGDVIVSRSTTGQYCQGDIVTMLDQVSRFQTGSCSFGSFTPYTK